MRPADTHNPGRARAHNIYIYFARAYRTSVHVLYSTIFNTDDFFHFQTEHLAFSDHSSHLVPRSTKIIVYSSTSVPVLVGILRILRVHVPTAVVGTYYVDLVHMYMYYTVQSSILVQMTSFIFKLSI